MQTFHQPNRVIGMMSGTSVDSIDAVLCEVGIVSPGRLGARVLGFREHALSPELRTRIFEAFSDGPRSLSLACSLNFEIGEAFAEAAAALVSSLGVQRSSIALIASHGQTLYHVAPHMAHQPGADRVASTLQLGEPAIIAERTGIRTIADFRVADMAAGGNGAPLVPFADYHLFSRPGEGIIVHNLGGISNCTYLPASGQMDEIVAFDTGPGNMLIDAFVQSFYPGESYDRDGRHASSGTTNDLLLSKWMTTPYISAKPPKSTGRELFGVQFAQRALEENPGLNGDDLISTATEFTARSIAVNLREHVFTRGPVTEVLLAGGGAQNPELVRRIATALPEVKVDLLDSRGVSSKARECVAFALLGYARLHNIPSNVPSATGARHPALLGKISDPSPAVSFAG